MRQLPTKHLMDLVDLKVQAQALLDAAARGGPYDTAGCSIAMRLTIQRRAAALMDVIDEICEMQPKTEGSTCDTTN